MARIIPNSIIIATFACIIAACGSGDKNTDQQSSSYEPIPASKELSELNERLKTDSSNAGLFYERAKCYMDIHDYNAALIDMSRVMRLDSTKPQYYITISDLYLYANLTGRSKTALEKCLALDPKNTAAMLRLAELYFYVKKYQESINYINEALKIDEHISQAYFLKGMNFRELGDTAKAISSMITATEQAPEYYKAFLEVSVLYAAQKNKLALSYCDNALRIDPTSIEALYIKGNYYLDNKDWDNAIKTYDELLKVEPKYKYAHYNLGAIALNAKKYDDAIIHFTNAINIDPKYAEAYFGRGTCYVQKNDKTKAKIDYQMAAQVAPGYTPADDALNALAGR